MISCLYAFGYIINFNAERIGYPDKNGNIIEPMIDVK